jgi:hypothetical protein
MSIKFVCYCGKRLKARDDMAGKRIPCPRCGNPIGVPSLDPNHPTPMTPAERLRAKAQRPITFAHLDDARAAPAEREEESWKQGERNRQQESQEAPEEAVPGTEDSVSSSQYSVPSSPFEARRADASSLAEGFGTHYSVPGTSDSILGPSHPAVPAPRPLDPTVVRLKKERRQRRQLVSRYDWPLEKLWYECLWYPFRAWPLVLALAGAMTLLTTALVLILPRVLAELTLDVPTVAVAAVCLVGPLLVPAYVCGFLDCVLAAGIAGESRHVRWPGRELGLIVRSFFAWLLAFLSAPAPLAAIGFYYWLYCGDLQVVDWIILAELGVVGSGYWLLAVLAVARSERLRDANPWRVAELAERLGWRALVAAVLAGVLFLSHGLLAIWTTSVLHDNLGLGLLLAAGSWLSWLYWATFVFRVVGLWCYYRSLRFESRKHEKRKHET